MPGKIIKLFDTQADWESGALSNMDSTTKPGSIAPNPSLGPEVYWISPVIDTSKSKSDRLTIGVETDMDIKRSIRASNYTFARPSVAYKLDGTQVGANVPRFEQGKFGKAIMVEEGTTNLLPTSKTNYPAWGKGTGIASVSFAEETFYGFPVCLITAKNDGLTALTFVRISSSSIPLTLNIGDKYSATFYVKKVNHRYVGFRVFTSGTYGDSQSVLDLDTGQVYANNPEQQISAAYIGNGWWKVIVINPSLTLTTGYIGICLPIDSAGAENTVCIGQSVLLARTMQLEAKPYATSFIDGTRSPETLSLLTNVLNPQQGSVECWVLVNDASKRMISGTYPTIFMADGGGAGKGIWLMHEDTAADFRVQIANQSASKNIRIADSLVTNGWHHFACTWNSAQAKLYLDGQLKGIMVDPPLPSAINALTVGCWGSGHQIDTLIDDFRISSAPRSDAEILANYQSGQPVGVDEYTTYYEPFDGLDDWQEVGVVFQNPHIPSLQVKIEPSKTKVGTQYIDSLGLWETITLPMLERPDIEIAPPECNKVTVYASTIEKSAVVPGTSSDRIVEIRVEAPAGSSEAYCQQMADAILAAKSKERLSITCKVPLVTSLRFGELVPVILPYIGATIDKPYMAHVQRMEHHILDNPPYTILSLGDFLPDDIEALVRLLKEG